MVRTKLSDLAEIAWIATTEPDGWVGCQLFADRLHLGAGGRETSARRRFSLALRAAEALDWPLERRMTIDEDGTARTQVRPLSTALVLDAHLAAFRAGNVRPGFGAALARLAARYPFAEFAGDPLDAAAVEAGLRALVHPRSHEADTIVHEAADNRLVVIEDGKILGTWKKT